MDDRELTAAQVDKTRKLTLQYAIDMFEAKNTHMVNIAWVIEQLEEMKHMPIDASVITGEKKS